MTKDYRAEFLYSWGLYQYQWRRLQRIHPIKLFLLKKNILLKSSSSYSIQLMPCLNVLMIFILSLVFFKDTFALNEKINKNVISHVTHSVTNEWYITFFLAENKYCKKILNHKNDLCSVIQRWNYWFMYLYSPYPFKKVFISISLFCFRHKNVKIMLGQTFIDTINIY